MTLLPQYNCALRFIAGICLFSLVSLQDVCSQNLPIVQISEFIESNPSSTIDTFLFADDKSAYFVNYDYRQLVISYELEKLNIDSLTVESMDLSYFLDGNKLLYKGAVYVDGKLFCFYTGKQKLKGMLYAIEVDCDQLTFSKQPIPIISTNITTGTEFVFEESLDSRYFAILTYEEPFNKSRRNLRYVYSFDANLKNLFVAEPAKDLPKNYLRVSDYKIDNTGRIDLLIELRKYQELVSENRTYKFLVASFGKNDSSFSVWDIGDSSDIILDMQMDINDEGKVFVSGFYGGENNWGVNNDYGYAGVISKIINPDTKEILLNKKCPLTPDLLDALQTVVHKDQIYEYYLKQMHVAENGYQALVCKKIMNGILVIGLNAEGQIVWYRTQGNFQLPYTYPEDIIYTKLKSYLINDNLNILYNDNKTDPQVMQLKLISIDIMSGKSANYNLLDSEKTKTRFIVGDAELLKDQFVFLFCKKNVIIPNSYKVAVLKY